MDIIAVDHGFSQMKTPHHVFTSGINEASIGLPSFMDILHFNGINYQVGGKRIDHNRDKTTNDDYYLLTLAAIAREIKTQKLSTDGAIHLAVGLPLMDYQRDCAAFSQYLKRDGQPVYFRFDNVGYQISIEKVSCYVQGYAAIVKEWDQGRLNDEEPVCAVVDVGGWTTDTFVMIEGSPQTESMISHEIGMIDLFNRIQQKVQSQTGSVIQDAHIKHHLLGKSTRLDAQITQLIKEECQQYAASLLSKLSETKIDIRNTPLIFLGGGALLLRPFLQEHIDPTMLDFIDDLHANVKGYEVLAYAAESQGY